eukprot:718287-Pelagomonas_calceolata.AAC.6
MQAKGMHLLTRQGQRKAHARARIHTHTNRDQNASQLYFSPCPPATPFIQTPPQLAGFPKIPWQQAGAPLPACWSICDGNCDGTSTALHQPSLEQAPSRPMGRILALFFMLASLILPWGERAGCWGVVGCLQGGLSHPRPFLP